MIKKIGNLSEMYADDINSVLQGTSFAIWCAKNEQEKYDKFKKGELDKIEDYDKKCLNILYILENLGYPMEELGTYLYKDVIDYTYEEVKNYSKRDDMQKARKLMEDLQDAYSNFYHWIARDDKEMGITSFHLFIERAIDKIDDKKIDKELASKIFDNSSKEENYGLQAFRLASFLANKYYMDSDEYEKPKLKKLSNTPKNRLLKGEYV